MMLVLKNARILTVTSGTIENGDILIDEGKIKAVGSFPIPAGCEIKDCTGKWITPGFIDAHSHISGLNEPNTMPGKHDVNEMTSPETSYLRALDFFNPFEISIENARKGGFTAACTLPGSANVIGGTGFAFKMKKASTVLDMAIPGTECMKMAFGENPRFYHGNSGKYPSTRMGVAALLRETLTKAKNYSEKLLKDENTPRDFRLDALVPVVRGEMQVRMHCHRADDIVTAMRIASEFGLKYSLEHCTEGHKIVDLLQKEKPFCVIGPLLMITGTGKKMELWEGRLDNAAILSEAGIPICLTEDAASATQWLPFHVGLIRTFGGLSFETALKGLTINPAALLGISDRMGSIEVGKDADIAIFTGDPFVNTTVCTDTVIDGEVYSHC